MAKLKGIINVNGRIEAIDQAKVPVMDHGFLYGDSIYETSRTFQGFPFQLQEHIRRLFHSAAYLKLNLPWTPEMIMDRILKTQLHYWKKYKNKEDVYIRVIISRGFGDIGFDLHLCPSPTLIIIVKELTPIPPERYQTGLHIALVKTIRNHPKALDPNVKTGNYLNNILAYLEAKHEKAEDALLENDKGQLTECTRSNLFLIKDGKLHTPSLDSGILRGLTRELVIQTAKEQGFDVLENHLTAEDLFSADECFICSSLQAIMPVTRCNHKAIGTGRPGPITTNLMGHFKKAMTKHIAEVFC
ncbi:MAG: aminotransferase class IV [Deltaproteobacteria bacterium]|nr:aminotransferase class IV [Deltaproteobacteria bacterium]